MLARPLIQIVARYSFGIKRYSGCVFGLPQTVPRVAFIVRLRRGAISPDDNAASGVPAVRPSSKLDSWWELPPILDTGSPTGAKLRLTQFFPVDLTYKFPGQNVFWAVFLHRKDYQK